MYVFREEHPDLLENTSKKASNVPEKPMTPQQLWYTHEKKAHLKIHPEVISFDSPLHTIWAILFINPISQHSLYEPESKGSVLMCF